MPHHQRVERIAGGVVVRGACQQLADQHRRFAHAAIARIGTEIAEVKHLLRGGEQLQEQEAVVLARGTVAMPATVGTQFSGQAIEPGGRVAAREIAIVHTKQADHAERQQAHRHHAAETDAAGEQRRARVRLAQYRSEMRTHHLGRHLAGVVGAHCIAGELVDHRAQAIQRALRMRRGGRGRNQCFQQSQQPLAPLHRRHRVGQHRLMAFEHPQQPQQGIERGQRAAFQLRPRRHAIDVVVGAAGMAKQQPPS